MSRLCWVKQKELSSSLLCISIYTYTFIIAADVTFTNLAYIKKNAVLLHFRQSVYECAFFLIDLIMRIIDY